MAVDRARQERTTALLRAQNRAISWVQLRGLGWTRAEVATRVKRGEWHRRHLGVYIAGDPETLQLAEESAALLSLGPRSVLERRTATALWGLAPAFPRPVDVLLVASSVRPRTRLRIHLATHLDRRDIRIRHNLRVTAPARSLIDFASDAASTEVEQAFSEAVVRRLTDEHDLRQALERAPANHPGAAAIRRRLHDDPDLLLHTRSPAERILLPLVLQAGLPRPAVNVRVHGELVDLHWPGHRLIVEFDGFQFHSSRAAFESDRARDRKLTLAGYRVIRITWWQLTRQPYAVVADIAQALAISHPQAA